MTTNHLLMSLTLDSTLDSIDYEAVIDLNNQDITLFDSKTAFGDCFAISGSSISNILQAHTSEFVRVPCFVDRKRLLISLNDQSLTNSNSFQILIKDIKFTTKKSYSLPVEISKDPRICGRWSTVLTTQITEDQLVSSDLSSLTYYYSHIGIDLNNLTTLTPDLPNFVFYLEIRNNSATQDVKSLGDYLSYFSYLPSEIQVNISSATTRSALFNTVVDPQVNGLVWIKFQLLNTTNLTDLANIRLFLTTFNTANNIGGKLWVYNTGLNNFVYFDENIESTGFAQPGISSSVLWETQHYGPIWVMNITFNDTIPLYLNAIINIVFTGATPNCDDDSGFHECYLRNFFSSTSQVAFKKISNSELEISSFSASPSQTLSFYMNMSYNRAAPINFAAQVTLFVNPSEIKTNVSTMAASLALDRSLHGFTRFLVAFNYPAATITQTGVNRYTFFFTYNPTGSAFLTNGDYYEIYLCLNGNWTVNTSNILFADQLNNNLRSQIINLNVASNLITFNSIGSYSTSAGTFIFRVTLRDVETPAQIFSSSRFKPYLILSIRRKATGTWDYHNTYYLPFNLTNRFEAQLVQTPFLESTMNVYSIRLSNLQTINPNHLVTFRFSQEFDPYLGYNSSLTNQPVNCAASFQGYQVNCYIYSPRVIAVYSPNFGSVNTMNVSIWVKPPAPSSSAFIQVTAVDDTSVRTYVGNITLLLPSTASIPKLTNTNVFQRISAKIFDPANYATSLGIDFSVLSQICKTSNTSVTNVNETCLGDRSICLASGNCILSNNTDLTGNKNIDSLIISSNSELGFSALTKCYINNNLIQDIEIYENSPTMTGYIKLKLNVPISRNVNYTLRCNEISYKPKSSDNLNLGLYLSSNRTFIAYSLTKLQSNTNNFILSPSGSYHSIANFKNNIQYDVISNYDLNSNFTLMLGLPSQLVSDNYTSCQGISSSYSYPCSVNTSLNQFKLLIPGMKRGDKISFMINQITNPSSNTNLSILLNEYDSTGKILNETISLQQQFNLISNFKNISSKKLEYLYTLADTGSDNRFNMTFKFVFPKNISGSILILTLPSTINFAGIFKIKLKQNGISSSINEMFTSSNKLIIYLNNPVLGTQEVSLILIDILNDGYSISNEIVLEVLNEDLAIIQRFSSIAYPQMLRFPQAFGLSTSQKDTPLIITAEATQNILTSNHEISLNFNDFSLENSTCYLIKTVSNEDYHQILEDYAKLSFSALKLNCTQNSSRVTFNRFSLDDENIFKSRDILNHNLTSDVLISNGDIPSIIILSSKVQIGLNPTFDLIISLNSTNYDRIENIPISVSNSDLNSSSPHNITLSNPYTAEMNDVSFEFAMSSELGVINMAIVEFDDQFISISNPSEISDVACSIVINQVEDDISCYMSHLDSKVYVQNFSLQSGSNMLTLTIRNLQNGESNSNIAYKLKVLDGVNGNLLFFANQTTIISSNSPSIISRSNVLGFFGEDNKLLKKVFQCSNTYGNEITLREKSGLLFNQELDIYLSISAIKFDEVLNFDDASKDFIFSNPKLSFLPQQREQKFRIAGLKSGVYLLDVMFYNTIQYHESRFLFKDSVLLYVSECTASFTVNGPSSLVPNSKNLPFTIQSSHLFPFDTIIQIGFVSTDSQLVENLGSSNPTTIILPALKSSIDYRIEISVNSTANSLLTTFNISYGRNQESQANIDSNITLGLYQPIIPNILSFNSSNISSNSACFTGISSKPGRFNFIITTYLVSPTVDIFNRYFYENETFYLESDPESWIYALQMSEGEYIEAENWYYSGAQRKRVIGRKFISNIESNFEFCVDSLIPDSDYFIYYFLSDLKDINSSISSQNFLTLTKPNEVKFELMLNNPVSLYQIQTILRPKLAESLSFVESWLRIDHEQVSQFGTLQANQSINEFMNNSLIVPNNRYNFRVVIPKILEYEDILNALRRLQDKIAWINSKLSSNIQIDTSFLIQNSLSVLSKPSQDELKIELLASPFRGFSGDIVFPIHTQNIHKLHIVVLKLSSFEAFNIAYNEISLGSEEIANASFVVDRSVNYRYVYDLNTYQLRSVLQNKDPMIDYNLDAASDIWVNYSNYRASVIDSKSVNYVPITFNSKGIYRVYISGEYSFGNEVYSNSTSTLPEEIRNSELFSEIFFGEVDNWKLLAGFDQIIVDDLKSMDGTVLVEIPNFLSVLSINRLMAGTFSLLLLLCLMFI